MAAIVGGIIVIIYLPPLFDWATPSAMASN
jgi:hypothetical protein